MDPREPRKENSKLKRQKNFTLKAKQTGNYATRETLDFNIVAPEISIYPLFLMFTS